MKLKAFFLVFLCFFATITACAIVAVAPGFALKEKLEYNGFEQQLLLSEPFGDPVDIPGPGGKT